jgi:hypothetical protein
MADDRDAAPDVACPCLHTTPCHERCTCVMPLSSSGCQRCCSYGSAEQRAAAAEALAKIIDLGRQKHETEKVVLRNRQLSNSAALTGHDFILGANGLVVGCTCGLQCNTVGFSAHRSDLVGKKIVVGFVSILNRFEIMAQREHFEVQDQSEPGVYGLNHRHILAFYGGSLTECLAFLEGWTQHRQVAEERS